jgi:predicted metal-dependent hydrolase
MVMKLTPVGYVVFIPKQFKETNPQVKAFIESALKELGLRAFPTAEVTSQAEMRRMVKMWAARLGLEVKRIQFRDMYRKWGSCSSIGNITLNTALCRVPRPLAEYVVLHEVVHLRVLNHGKEFKALMTEHMPDWKDHEAELSKLLARKTD